jgi:hypothetical protein
MTGIIDAIDDYTSDRYSAYNKKLYGFCELVKKTAGEGGAEQVMPVTIPDLPATAREHVAINDGYNLITWIRWAAPVVYSASEEWSFGKDEARMGTLTLRVIFAHKTSLGETLVFDFINALPTEFSASGYQFIHVEGAPSVDPDHEAIWLTEFGNTSYEKHRFTWNLYAVNITVQFLECEELTP